jgi:hypothetical protein
MRFSLPDLLTLGLASAKAFSFSNSRHPYEPNDAALDAVSLSMVASSYLTPPGKIM